MYYSLGSSDQMPATNLNPKVCNSKGTLPYCANRSHQFEAQTGKFAMSLELKPWLPKPMCSDTAAAASAGGTDIVWLGSPVIPTMSCLGEGSVASWFSIAVT